MAKSKADLLAEAKELGLEVTEKNTIAQINEAISAKTSQNSTVDTETVEASVEKEAHFTKAGKRSAKAVSEEEAEAARLARKESGDTTPQDEDVVAAEKKGPRPVTRPLIERRGKKYQEVAKKIDNSKTYSLQEAVALAVETSTTKFDSSVEIHVSLGVDPRQADQNIRTTVSLPNGTGKTVRVAAFVTDKDQAAAKEAGADIIGEEAVIALLDKQQLDFDVIIATPQQMPKLGKYARVLGPRGLMPNPKSGTVTTNVATAIKEAKGGKVEYRVDKQAIVHVGVGKVSFGADKLSENASAFFDSLNSVKPSSLKGSYIKSISVATTMGPGIRVDQNSL